MTARCLLLFGQNANPPVSFCESFPLLAEAEVLSLFPPWSELTIGPRMIPGHAKNRLGSWGASKAGTNEITLIRHRTLAAEARRQSTNVWNSIRALLSAS
jgi:hypothetical protein